MTSGQSAVPVKEALYRTRLQVRRLTTGLVLFCAVAVASLTFIARAQSPTTAPAGSMDGMTVRQLHIEGLQRIDEGYIRNQMRIRPGEPYTAAQISEDISRLYRTGRFQDVRATPVLVDGQINLTLTVAERPLIQSVEIVGSEKYKLKDLTKLFEFAAGDPVDRFLINQGREQIEKKYRDDGHSFVEVTIDEEALKNEQQVIYRIVEGPRVRIRKIVFEGNVSYKPKALLKLLNNVKTYIWIFRKGQYDPEGAERDAANIQTFYREHGFLEAEVSYRSEFMDEAREKLRVVFVINEGIRYSVREIKVNGSSVYTADQILGLMTLNAGQYFDAFKLKAEVESVIN